MSDKNSVQFGLSIDPAAASMAESFERARLADELGLDLITLMDHPYNGKLFDTWTLLTALALSTKRIHVGTNVLNLPLRPPAMLAKQAATLDVLSNGRVEIGLGAGAYWEGIEAYGGPRRTPGEAYRGFKDALHILRGMWDSGGATFSYEGDIYQVKKVRSGPSPAHPIPIWAGAYGPKMLGLVGQMGDGLLVSYNYAPPEKLSRMNTLIDEGAREAGRAPKEIRRGYNLMGVINTGAGSDGAANLAGDIIKGPPLAWAEKIVGWHQNYRQDTFIFWPVGGDAIAQIRLFANEVIPAVKQQLS